MGYGWDMGGLTGLPLTRCSLASPAQHHRPQLPERRADRVGRHHGQHDAGPDGGQRDAAGVHRHGHLHHPAQLQRGHPVQQREQDHQQCEQVADQGVQRPEAGLPGRLPPGRLDRLHRRRLQPRLCAAQPADADRQLLAVLAGRLLVLAPGRHLLRPVRHPGRLLLRRQLDPGQPRHRGADRLHPLPGPQLAAAAGVQRAAAHLHRLQLRKQRAPARVQQQRPRGRRPGVQPRHPGAQHGGLLHGRPRLPHLMLRVPPPRAAQPGPVQLHQPGRRVQHHHLPRLQRPAVRRHGACVHPRPITPAPPPCLTRAAVSQGAVSYTTTLLLGVLPTAKLLSAWPTLQSLPGAMRLPHLTRSLSIPSFQSTACRCSTCSTTFPPSARP